MRVFRGLPKSSDAPLALTIGNFDGVHRGHQAMLMRLIEGAEDLRLEPAVLTFEPHPREFFAPDSAPPRLSTLRSKLEMFRALDRGGVSTKGDLIFLASAQEELGMVGSRHWLQSSGYKPDMFIAVDLSSNHVWYGALRVSQFKFLYTSPGAHTLESRGAASPRVQPGP